MIETDTSPVTSLAVCHLERGGCGQRSPIYRTRAKALAWAERHRAEAHPELVSELEGARRQRNRQGVAA